MQIHQSKIQILLQNTLSLLNLTAGDNHYCQYFMCISTSMQDSVMCSMENFCHSSWTLVIFLYFMNSNSNEPSPPTIEREIFLRSSISLEYRDLTIELRLSPSEGSDETKSAKENSFCLCVSRYCHLCISQGFQCPVWCWLYSSCLMGVDGVTSHSRGWMMQ